jgi:hypothetical protein
MTASDFSHPDFAFGNRTLGGAGIFVSCDL